MLDAHACFQALNQSLLASSALWQCYPLYEAQYPWRDDALPNTHCDESVKPLIDCLNGLSDDAVFQLSSQQGLHDAHQLLAPLLSPWLKLDDLNALTVLPKVSGGLPYATQVQKKSVPGRKLEQIQSFSRLLDGSQQQVLEWCAGKGFLGRFLALKAGAHVHSLEYQQALCDAGQQFARQYHVPQNFTCLDVFDEAAQVHLRHESYAVALHACGDLHDHLITSLDASVCQGASIVPCCYHLTQSESYQPLSSAAQQSALCLSRLDLSLPLRESVTAAARETQFNDQKILWRLGFDQLLKNVQGTQDFVSLPSFSQTLLAEGFEAFIAWGLQEKSLLCEFSSDDVAEALAQAQARLQRMRRVELVQSVFRRPLELWILYDKVLYLQEQGFDAQLLEFCDYNLSPRNIAIQVSGR